LEQIINKIKQKLNADLPGENAQFLMAPLERRRMNVENFTGSDFKRSAVMLVLCRDENDNLFIPLTERFAYDGVHSGQVSFPGGKFDDGDLNYEHTAARECFEEIGIANIEIIGNLTELFIPVSKFLVHPVVGYCSEKNTELRKNPREVKAVLKLFLNDLMNENIVKSGLVKTRNEQKIQAPYFEVEGLKVWGATAMILSEFKTVLKTIF